MAALSESRDSTDASDSSEPNAIALAAIVPRAIAGGVLMGLANLVPGISGGTMLVATGIYTRFINAIAEVTTLKFKPASIATLACVVLAAVIAIGLGAGAIKTMVVDHRWMMYAIFIGLTLGGVPVVWKMLGRPTRATWGGVVAGCIMMAALAWMQLSGAGLGEADGKTGFVMMIIAGVAGASAMILPGVSGGYLLLVLGVYIPILAAISTVTTALKARDFAALGDPTINVILPVGIGVVIGVVVVSNALRYCLQHFEKATLGVLIGLLVGAVVGLIPFQQGVAPEAGDTFRGDTVVIIDGQPAMQTTGKIIEPDKFPVEFFTPTPMQIAIVIGLVVLGFAITMLIARLGNGKSNNQQNAQEIA